MSFVSYERILHNRINFKHVYRLFNNNNCMDFSEDSFNILLK